MPVVWISYLYLNVLYIFLEMAVSLASGESDTCACPAILLKSKSTSEKSKVLKNVLQVKDEKDFQTFFIRNCYD